MPLVFRRKPLYFAPHEVAASSLMNGRKLISHKVTIALIVSLVISALLFMLFVWFYLLPLIRNPNRTARYSHRTDFVQIMGASIKRSDPHANKEKERFIPSSSTSIVSPPPSYTSPPLTFERLTSQGDNLQVERRHIFSVVQLRRLSIPNMTRPSPLSNLHERENNEGGPQLNRTSTPGSTTVSGGILLPPSIYLPSPITANSHGHPLVPKRRISFILPHPFCHQPTK
ncbi:hypothetical protein B0H34DRAFT_715937 [Crassisporium funariophilum]|nr:hypothetical protein B0H34DRAFT_715937 [Crassisporium funariophilum]